jgi:hypothetical protein
MRYIDSNPFGYLGDADEKIIRFTSGDPLAGVDRDATNGWYRPGNAAQWNAVKNVASIPAIPVSAHNFQELAGPTIADLLGSKPLTVSGAAAYGVAIAGATTKGIGGSATATNQFASNTSVANANTTEVAYLLYAVTQTPTVGHQRAFHGGASNNAFEGVSGSAVMRYRIGAASGNGALAHGGQLRPVMVVRRAGQCCIYSDQEKKDITPTTPASATSFQVQFRIAADVSTSTVFNYAARFEGAGAAFTDALVKTLLQTLGITVTGY